MQTKIIERYFFFGLLVATLLFTFMIFRPFWVVLVLGASFSVVLYPVYEWLKRHKTPNWLSSLLTVIFFMIVVCGPLLGIATMLFNQSQDVYHAVADTDSTTVFLNTVNQKVNNFLPESMMFDVNEKISAFLSFVSGNIAIIFSSTISALFSFILILLIIFYLLKDGEKWRRAIIVLSPLADKDDEKIIKRLKDAVNAVIKGYFFIALVQGILMGIGLWLFGIPNAGIWGVVAAVASLLPTIGTALVSIPATIFLFATGHTTAAIGLIIWSVVLVGMIDNLLSPLVVGSKINIPPLLILFAVLGGVALLGPVGILVGPLTLSLLYTLISIYRNEFKISAY